MSNISLTSSDQVRNIEGTNVCLPRGFSSWKSYWTRESGRDWPDTCRISRCRELAVGGGHVNVRRRGKEVYIIPMCSSHNTPHNTAWMDVKPQTVAVFVDSGDTKGPKGVCWN